MRLASQLDALRVRLLLISADPPETSARFRKSLSVPDGWALLSDPSHEVADRFGVPISRKHPKAASYPDGFIQPAVFAYTGETEVFTFIQTPAFWNLWGAARRPEPAQVVEALQARLG